MAPPRIEIVVVTPFQQNCQLLWDPDAGTGIVVDPGGDVPRILQRIAANGLAIEAILLTHGHLDHAGGMNDVTPDRYLEEDEVLELAGCRLEVRHVPGHTPGHVVFIEATRRFGLVGDTLFKGSVVRTDFPYCD